MFALHVPHGVHEFDTVEGAAAFPGGAGGVGGFAFESELNGHEAGVVGGLAVGGGKLIADMTAEHDVDVFQQAGADEEGFRAKKFFGDAGKEFQRAFDAVPGHQILHGERGDDVDGVAGVVAFAVARGAINERVMISDAGLLIGAGNAVEIGDEADNGFTAIGPGGDPGGGDAGDTAFDLEAIFLKDGREVFGSLDFLKAEFTEAEDGVDDFLDHLGAPVDVDDSVFFELFEARGLRERGTGGEKREKETHLNLGYYSGRSSVS